MGAFGQVSLTQASTRHWTLGDSNRLTVQDTILIASSLNDPELIITKCFWAEHSHLFSRVRQDLLRRPAPGASLYFDWAEFNGTCFAYYGGNSVVISAHPKTSVPNLRLMHLVHEGRGVALE